MARDLFEEQGIDLFEQEGVDLFEQAAKVKPKSTFKQDFDIAVTGLKNTGDIARSMVTHGLSSLFDKEASFEGFDRMQNRINQRNAALPDVEQGFGGKLAGAAMTLPAQLLAFPLSPFETGKTAIDKGESLSNAQKAVGVDTLGNMAGILAPAAIPGSLATRALTGAGINAGQDFITRKGIQSVLETPKGKEAFAPTMESAGISAVIGGGMGAVLGKGKKSKTDTPPRIEPGKIGDIVKQHKVAEVEQVKVDQEVKPPLATEGTPELLPSNAPQYGIDHSNDSGHWTTGPDGMPFRADLSMEAQALQNPLQRDLWGEELGPAQGAERSLTEAIDAMPDKQPAVDLLSPELPATDALTKAADLDTPTLDLPAKPTSGQGSPLLNQGMGRGQRGAIDLEFLDAVAKKGKEALEQLRELAWDKFWNSGRNYDGEEYQDVKAINQKIYEVEQRERISTGMAVNSPKEIYPGYTHIPSGTKIKATHGLKYQEPTMATVVGTKDIRFEDGPYRLPVVDFGDGNPRTLLPADIKEIYGGPRKLRKESGGIDVEGIYESTKAGLAKLRSVFGEPKDSINTPISPETIAAKQTRIKKYKALDISLDRWADPATSEEALSLAKDAGDIKSTKAGRLVAPGNNFMAAYHNHPVLKYMRKLVNDTRGEITTFNRQYLTAKDGVSNLITKLKGNDRVQVSELVYELDKQQVDYTPEIGAKVGLSPTAMKLMESMKKALDAEWEWRKKLMESQGVTGAPKRRGYSPGVFRGDYISMVTDKDGTVVGMIAVDTPGEFMLAKQYYEKNNPGAKFSANDWRAARKPLGGTQQQAFKYTQLGEIINLLSSVDGDLSKAQLKIDKDILRATTDLFGMQVHNFSKKGISGNQGNKPWLSPEKNANARLDAVVRFLEDSAEHHALQKAHYEMDLITKDPTLDNMPKLKSYINDYWSNVKGIGVSDAGKIANLAFDNASKIFENTPGVNKYVGRGKILEASNFVKNKMTQLYMAWGNLAFLYSQLKQPVQTALPLMELARSRIGASPAELADSLKTSAAQFLKVKFNELGVFPKEFRIDPRIAEILEWGSNRGILDFSENERVYEGHKSEFGRKYDNVAEFTLKLGEQYTRPPVFLTFVELLSKAEPDLQKVLPIAENLTNQAMVDYHKWERPLMYQGLGVLAPHAGGLTTFKHNYMGSQALLGQEIKSTKNPVPAALSGLAILSLAGITGIPMYETMNSIYEEAREWIFDERRSIAQDTMQNFPQWLKTGAISSMYGLNIQGKFSAAQMVPEDIYQAAAPHLSGAYDIGKSAYEFAKDPNENTFGNLAVTASPSGFKQAAKMAFKKEDDWLLDKYGKHDVQRTPEEWTKSAITGLVPMKEATERSRQFQNIENERARTELMTKLSTSYKNAVITGDIQEQADILNRVEELGGDPFALMRQTLGIEQDAEKSTQERLEGTPKSRESARRYEAYQE